MPWEDYDQVPGWPAASTRVYQDTTRIGPRPLRQEDLEAKREASRKWKATHAELNRANDRERKRTGKKKSQARKARELSLWRLRKRVAA